MPSGVSFIFGGDTMSNKLLDTDKLYQAYPKINEAIDNAENALYKSTNAVNTANQAKAKSDDTQQQLDTIVIESGTSDAETLQARGGFPLLKDRLESVDAQLAEKAEKTEVSTVNTQLESAVSRIENVEVRIDDIVAPKIEPLEFIAHRGFGGLAPENTLTAFTQAVALGADSLECDVQISSDGIAVLIHDETVDRTTNGTGNVKDMTLAALQALDAGSKFSTKFAGAKIPTFEDFLKYSKGRVKRIYPEIKSFRTIADIKIMVDLIKQYNMEEMTVLCSFDLSHLSEVRKYSNKIIFGFLKGGALPTTAEKDTLKSSEKNMLLIDYTTLANNANLFTEMASNGVEIGTWTINDRPNLDFLMALGATKIISDYFFGGLKS